MTMCGVSFWCQAALSHPHACRELRYKNEQKIVNKSHCFLIILLDNLTRNLQCCAVTWSFQSLFLLPKGEI